MKKIISMLLTLTMLLSFSMIAMASNLPNEVCPYEHNTEEQSERASDIICPACGSIGYPTGLVIPLSDTENDPMPLAIPMYQQYQCSADSSHYWYVYLYDLVN